MFRRPASLLVFSSVAFLCFAASSDARAIPSQVGVVGVAGVNPEEAVVVGVIASKNPKCLANRRVKVLFTTPGGKKLFDRARSSDNGGWQARGPLSQYTGATALTAKLLPRKIGPKKHRRSCDGDVQVLS